MPNRNGTGPDGGGPKTGRGLGPCNGVPTKGGSTQQSRRPRRGLRRGLGRHGR